MRRMWPWLAVVVVSMGFSPAWAQNTQRGAAVGGVTGAIAGALIGDHNGESGAGAAIGGAIGAVTGAVIGNARDKEIANERYYAQQRTFVAQQQAVSTADVVALCRSGVSDSVVIGQINQRGVQRRLEVSDIIALHQQGVSEVVISAMQSAPVGGPAVAAAPVVVERPVQPVVIREYDVAPVYVVPHHHYYRPYHRTHVHFGYGW